MHCKDCKWWQADPPHQRGVCELHDGNYGDPKHAESLAWASVGTEGNAWFVTLADFGCVQFETNGKEKIPERGNI